MLWITLVITVADIRQSQHCSLSLICCTAEGVPNLVIQNQQVATYPCGSPGAVSKFRASGRPKRPNVNKSGLEFHFGPVKPEVNNTGSVVLSTSDPLSSVISVGNSRHSLTRIGVGNARPIPAPRCLAPRSCHVLNFQPTRLVSPAGALVQPQGYFRIMAATCQKHPERRNTRGTAWARLPISLGTSRSWFRP